MRASAELACATLKCATLLCHLCLFGRGWLGQLFVASLCIVACFVACICWLPTSFIALPFCVYLLSSGLTTSQDHPFHVCLCFVPSPISARVVDFLCDVQTHIPHVFNMFKDCGDCSSEGIPMHSTFTKQCGFKPACLWRDVNAVRKLTDIFVESRLMDMEDDRLEEACKEYKAGLPSLSISQVQKRDSF